MITISDWLLSSSSGTQWRASRGTWPASGTFWTWTWRPGAGRGTERRVTRWTQWWSTTGWLTLSTVITLPALPSVICDLRDKEWMENTVQVQWPKWFCGFIACCKNEKDPSFWVVKNNLSLRLIFDIPHSWSKLMEKIISVKFTILSLLLL